MSNSHSLSAAEQRNLISLANVAVSRFANSFMNRLGNKHFFTREDLEDFGQDVVMKAWLSLDSFDPKKGTLSAWINRIAINHIKDAIDYRVRRLAISAPFPEDNEELRDEYSPSKTLDRCMSSNPKALILVSEFDADRDLYRKEFESCVQDRVQKLNATNQRFTRMLIDGFAPREMAAIEGCTANAASRRIFIIRHALKATLADVAREFDITYDRIAC